MDGQQIYENFASSRGSEGLAESQAQLKQLMPRMQELSTRVRQQAAKLEEAWTGEASGAAQRGAGPLAVEQARTAEQFSTADDLLRRQAESYEYAKRNVRPVPPMPTQPPMLTDLVTNGAGAQNSYFAQAQASQDAARNNVEQMNTWSTASNYNDRMMPTQYGQIDGSKFDISSSESSSGGSRAGVGGVGGAVPSVGATSASAGTSSGAGGGPAGSASRIGGGSSSGSAGSVRPSATAPAATSGPLSGVPPRPGVGEGGAGQPRSYFPPPGSGSPGVGGLPPGGPGAGGPRGAVPGGGALRGGPPGGGPVRGGVPGGQPGGRLPGQLPGGAGAGQAGAGRAGMPGGRAGAGSMMGGPGAGGRGRGDEDSEHKRKVPLERELDIGPDVVEDEYGEKTLDETGRTVVPPVIGDEQPEPAPAPAPTPPVIPKLPPNYGQLPPIEPGNTQ